MKDFQTLQTTLSDAAFQEHILQGVSRTFALTIPALPQPLCLVVGNTYLLCRIADTIEDAAALSARDKQAHSSRFVQVVRGQQAAEDFARELLPRLAARIPEAERELIANTAAVLRITHGFSAEQQRSLGRCVRIMVDGMSHYQRKATLDGLRDVEDMGRYCYYVAGVVGETLTDLFCAHCPDMRRRRDMLMPLAVSFGQALQMTNILKDVWEDHARGACWLPRDVFACRGLDIRSKSPGAGGAAYGRALEELIAIAHGHLRRALEYTLLIPQWQRGMRRFCLWALGMAALTLSRIQRNPCFRSGQEVKISRRSVRMTVWLCDRFASRDRALRYLFRQATRRLPPPPRAAAGLLPALQAGVSSPANRPGSRGCVENGRPS